jgi:hypothetical protein
LYVSKPTNVRYHSAKELINIFGLKSDANVYTKVPVKKICKTRNISANNMVYADKRKCSIINE